MSKKNIDKTSFFCCLHGGGAKTEIPCLAKNFIKRGLKAGLLLPNYYFQKQNTALASFVNNPDKYVAFNFKTLYQ